MVDIDKFYQGFYIQIVEYTERRSDILPGLKSEAS